MDRRSVLKIAGAVSAATAAVFAMPRMAFAAYSDTIFKGKSDPINCRRLQTVEHPNREIDDGYTFLNTETNELTTLTHLEAAGNG